MTTIESSERQASLPRRRSRLRIGILPVTATVIAAAAMISAAAMHRPIGLVTRDPNQISDSPPLAGVLSTLGNGMWAAALGIALFAHGRANGSDRRRLGALAALTAVLFLDDSLLLHDVLLPDLGVPELLINGGYVLVGVAVLAFTLELVASANALRPILAAGTLFAISMAWDVLDLDWWGKDLLFAVEDGSKFVGIAFWVGAIVAVAEYVDGSSEAG